jgi:syntaxin 7
MVDKLKKTSEELFRQFADTEGQISSASNFKQEENPHETFDPGFVEEESLAIRDEDELKQENLLKRNEDIQQVHRDFVEVNSMFKEVAHLVDQQGESLNVAEGHVDTAVKETGRANIELDSANKYQRSAKKKIVIIFIIVLVVVAILIGVVVATTL